MITMFLNAVDYCEQTYGSYIMIDEETGVVEGFICPHCEEPVYYEDWAGAPETENWMVCPICGEEWSEE